MRDETIVIGSWENNECRSLLVQDFVVDGEAFIPIFSDDATFNDQILGSGFEDSGIAIDRNLLASMLRGDELLILNPGGPDPLKLTKADLTNDRTGGGRGGRDRWQLGREPTSPSGARGLAAPRA